MKGVCLQFFTYELQKHHGMLVYEWLLEFAKKNGIHGGLAFRAVAGYGHHGVMHEEHFFELASNVPVEVRFLLTKEESKKLIDLIKNEKIKLFYSICEAEYGFLND
jgi:PII-like signaling protein